MEKEKSQLGVINRIFSIVFRPKKVFLDIKRDLKLLPALIGLMTIFFLSYIYQIDLLKEYIQFEVIKNNINLSGGINSALYSNIAIGVLSAVVNPLTKGSIVYLVLKLYKEKIKYRVVISIFIYASYILAFGNLITGFIKKLTNNLYINISINQIITNFDVGSKFYKFLSYFEFFNIYYILLTVMGLYWIYKISFKRIFIAISLPTIMYLVTLLLS